MNWKEYPVLKQEIAMCPKCGTTNIIEDSQTRELVCSECGLVINKRTLRRGREWRSYSTKEFMERSRAGAPVSPTRIGYGLDTRLSYTKRARTRSTRRLKLAKRHSRSKMERRVIPALFMIKAISEQLNLPTQTVEDAAILYRKASSAGLVKGRSMEAMVAAIVYASCRRTEVPRKLLEVASFFKLKEKEVSRSFRFLFRKLGIRIPPPRPEIYVPRICSDLRLPQSIATMAMRVLKVARQVGATLGRQPVAVAAGAVYLASQKVGRHRTQRELAGAAGVTEVTVRSRYREMVQKVLPVLESRRGMKG